ncbi:uncharacterized protein N7469_005375 [Penicillium citrinum]|uniref:Xylanolytic transcriptional activator regulatory domain-containing protein n=1 Tax=Penicillium citrinum TaxID=5077 RepID=A0A9W9P1G2_PENCI|nr:uncharacterized protein N7469_005375 [Penicillium citrinum]KAJ5233609.1 hypothetical protein N7469_005375 [Penicillium citrinum]
MNGRKSADGAQWHVSHVAVANYAVTCLYEDGFLWQQPATVGASIPPEQGSTVPQNDLAIQTPTDSGLTVSTRPDALLSTSNLGLGPALDTRLQNGPHKPQYENSHENIHQRPHSHPHPHKGKHSGRERGFLETVLGAPKAAVNQEPYVNTGLLQRQKRSAPEPELPFTSQADCEDPNVFDDEDALSPSQQLDISPRIMMRGRETKTRYSGSGIYANLVAQFPDIRPFAEEIRVTNPILSQVRPDLVRVKKGLWKRVPLNEPFPEPTTASLIALLPSRGVVDELIGLYLTYIECQYRILHAPSFLREVDQFFAMMDNPTNVSTAFLVQLLLVLACAWNLADIGSLQEKSPTPLKCYTGIEWVLHAEKWIDSAHIKRPEITALRMYILLIVAQNCFGTKRSKAWLSTGTLIRQAMLAGYHRDPNKYARISVFNKEMRRRIWMTIVELDLQVAIDRGMPPNIQISDYDTLPALNINDDEIHEGSTEAPKNRSPSEITDCSFPTVMAQSLPIRLKACQLMHSPRISCRYEEIQRLDWELSRQYTRIPTWVASNPNDGVSQLKVTLWKAIIETKLAQSLSVYSYTVRDRGESGSPIRAFGSVSSRSRNEKLMHPPKIGSTFTVHNLPGLPDSLISLVETALIALEHRFHLVVKGAKDYFFLSTIVALVKSKIWPAQSIMYKQQVVERVLSFTQSLFSRHATCEHLGAPGMGSFKDNQVATFVATPGMTTMLPTDFDGILPPPNLGVTPPGEFDPFLDVFDWEDLTGIALGN